MRGKTRRSIAGLALAALVWVAWWAWPYAESAALILDLTGHRGLARSLLPVRTRDVTTYDVNVPTRFGSVPARAYRPTGTATRAVVVFPGIHSGGVDEPRLAAFSRRLAATGATVLSVPLPDLRVYAITPRSTDMAEDVAVWMASRRDLAPSGRVAIAGISFGGGLALVAAGRPSLAGKVDFVVSLGGHGDLPRVLHYLCTGQLPDGTTRPPHDYGLAVLLLAALPHFVPPHQLDPLRRAIVTYLDASGAESTDPARSKTLLADAETEANALAEPATTVMRWVTTRDAKTVGPMLLPYLEELGGAAALSPERSPAATAPVFLLHGRDDNVIPSTETTSVAAYLHAAGNQHVVWLLSPIISHADAKVTSLRDAWDMVGFWKQVLAAPAR